MLNKIIQEEIKRTLNEGYFAQCCEKECKMTANRLCWKINTFTQNLHQSQFAFYDSIEIDYPIKGKQQKIKIPIKVNYIQTLPPNQWKGQFQHFFMNDRKIELLVGDGVTLDNIFGLLSHEVTHALDMQTYFNKNYSIKTHNLQDAETNSFVDDEKVREILYRLWDTTEFNAQQVPMHSQYHQDFFEHIMNLLNDINNDVSIDWNQVKNLLMYETDKIKKSTSPETVKKYFLTTSLKKLKKYVQKVW